MRPEGSETPTKYWYVDAPASQAGVQETDTRPVSVARTVPLVPQGAVAKLLVDQ
jgi:hypothetical protein